MSSRRTFTPAFKAQVVLEEVSGAKTAGQVCREHRLEAPLLSHWKQEFLKRAPQVFKNGNAQKRKDARWPSWRGEAQ